MNDTAIVIVTYNSGAEIGACLDAALRTEAELVVVDNGSTDRTIEEIHARGVRLIANGHNAGFATAVNQGFRATIAPFVLLLNPDAVLQTGIEPLRAACSLPGSGAAGGKLTGRDGSPQAGFTVRRLPSPTALCFESLGVNRLWPGNPVNWRFRCFDLDLEQSNPFAVEQPAGAFLMVRRDAWAALGGFDENFRPLWFEDVDFCRRLKTSGWKVFYAAGAVAKHTGAHAVSKLGLETRRIYWYGSLLKYAAKHYPPFPRRLVCVSVILGSVFRSLTGLFSRRGWNEWGHRRVIGLAVRYFAQGKSLKTK